MRRDERSEQWSRHVFVKQQEHQKRLLERREWIVEVVESERRRTVVVPRPLREGARRRGKRPGGGAAAVRHGEHERFFSGEFECGKREDEAAAARRGSVECRYTADVWT